MKKIIVSLLSLIILFIGCARVQVQAPKEPIKVDISMRLDIYQHVLEDIDDIESIVTGADSAAGKKEQGSFLQLFVKDAYAQDGFSDNVEQAALRRKARYQQIVTAQGQGLIGEGHDGLLKARGGAAGSLISEENNDRMIIYTAIAQKNGVSVREIQSVYAGKLSQQAPSGTPIEVYNPSTGGYEWKTK